MVAVMRWPVVLVMLVSVVLGSSLGVGAAPADSRLAGGAGPALVVLNECERIGAVAVVFTSQGGFASVYADNGPCAYYIEVGNCAATDEGALYCRDDTVYGVVELNVTAAGHLRFDAGFPGGTAAAEGDIIWT